MAFIKSNQRISPEDLAIIRNLASDALGALAQNTEAKFEKFNLLHIITSHQVVIPKKSDTFHVPLYNCQDHHVDAHAFFAEGDLQDINTWQVEKFSNLHHDEDFSPLSSILPQHLRNLAFTFKMAREKAYVIGVFELV